MLQLLLQRKFLPVRKSVRFLSLIVDEDMFNRSREVELLSQLLMSSPKLSVVTGPVNSGKSRLMEHVIAHLPKKSDRHVPVHNSNLRQGTYNSVESLVDSLSSDMKTWLTSIKEAIGDVSVSAVRFHLTRGPPLDRLNSLLRNIAKELPPYSILRGKHIPVFFIDEANRLRSLLCDKDGQAALESLFQWFVLHTKEKRHFHVVMASSDSFYNLWVERYIGSSRYTTYVLGHLDKDDARRYWEDRVLVDNAHMLKKHSLDPPVFENVFTVCGGSMFLMNLFIEEYCEEKGGRIGENPYQFSMVLQELRKLYAAFDPTKTFQENKPPRWSKGDITSIMKMLVNSKLGVVQYNSACDSIGKDIINSMIEYNLIHMRPTSRLSFDVPEHKRPIITAESPAALAAMKMLVNEEK